MLDLKFASALSRAVLIGALAAASARAAEFVAEKAGSSPQVAAASDEGELAIKRFRVPKGLKVELFAAEPMLANPVCFSIDEKGRFYVAETFRLHAGVTDIRGHMDWLDEELAVKTVEERIAYMTKHEGRKIVDYTKHSERVRLLEDTDGDGRADQATVFSERYNGIADGIGAGLLARQGSVYYANIPNLWLLKDTKSKGVADVRKSLSYGYGIRVGFLGHDLHGLRFGPDGKLYFSIGDRGAHLPQKGGKAIELHETGAVFRCDPDGSNVEVFATGLRNPQELAFDQFGNLWTGDNNSDGGDPARWVYVVEGGDSGWRVGWQFINSPSARGPWLSERMCYPQFDGQAAYILPPLANIANGPSGLAYYPGTGLNEKFKDRFFLCDFRGGTGSGIHSIAVKPRGASFEVSERSDFIWDVLVTDGDFGYDGCFYLTDWVNGWNQTGKGRIYRVFDPETRGSPLVAEVKKLMAEGFAQRVPGELASLLAHPDQRVRQEAQFALADKSAVDVFVNLLKLNGAGGWTSYSPVAKQTEPQLARLHAVWGLGQIATRKGQIGSPAAVDALLALGGDTDAEVRAQAAKVLGDTRNTRAYEVLLKLLGDAEPRPKFFAAIALGKLGKKEALPALLEMVRTNDQQDRYLRHAGVMGLVGCADAPTLGKLANDKSSAVRMAAVIALRRKESAEVTAFLKDSEPTIVLEVARAINDLPIPAALPQLASLSGQAAGLVGQLEATATKLAPKPDKKPDLVTPFLRRVINANFRIGAATNAAALAALASSPNLPDAMRAEAITVLGNWAKPSGRDNVTGLWRPLAPRAESLAKKALQPQLNDLLRSPSNPVKLAATKISTKLGLASGSTSAFDLLADASQPANLRVESLKSLAALKDAKLDDALKLAQADGTEALRKEAMKIEAQLRPGSATAKLRTTLDSGTPGEKQSAFTTLGTVPGSAADEILGQWLDKLLARQVAPELQVDLIEAAGQRTAPAVKDRLTKFERARDANDNLRSYRECLVGGDAAEGKRIFIEKQEVFCVRCHKVQGEGGEVGPDMTGIGGRQTREYLLESIVFPNQQIAQGFESLLVTMHNGTAYAGLLKSENDAELELNSPEDGPVKLKKADLKARERGPSAMPEEFRQILTKRELRDLVEFLSTVK